MRSNDIYMNKVHPPWHPPTTNNLKNLLFIMEMKMYIY